MSLSARDLNIKTYLIFKAQGKRWVAEKIENGERKKGHFRTKEEWLMQWPEQREKLLRERRENQAKSQPAEENGRKAKPDIACMEDFEDEGLKDEHKGEKEKIEEELGDGQVEVTLEDLGKRGTLELYNNF